MPRQPVPPAQWTAQPVGLFEPGWLLLTAGDYASGSFNAMTVSWGSLGVIWNKPFVQVVVQPQPVYVARPPRCYVTQRPMTDQNGNPLYVDVNGQLRPATRQVQVCEYD